MQSLNSNTTKVLIQKPYLLLVEGADEFHFFSSLILTLNLPNTVQIIDITGKNNFKNYFNALLKSKDFHIVKKIGFVRDADTDFFSAFQSICNILQQFGFSPPTKANQFTTGLKIDFGIFIMPNNLNNGMLEDLCLESIKNSAIMDCVDDYVNCIPQKAVNFKYSKAKTQVFLASKTDIAKSVGIGAQKGYWDFNNPCFNSIKDFLINLSK